MSNISQQMRLYLTPVRHPAGDQTDAGNTMSQIAGGRRLSLAGGIRRRGREVDHHVVPTAHVHKRAAQPRSGGEQGSDDLRTTVASW